MWPKKDTVTFGGRNYPMKNLMVAFVFVGAAVYAHTSRGEFFRPSVAYQSDEESGMMAEYDVNEPCYRKMAVCSVSDGEYRVSEGPAGEDIGVHTKNAEHFFGIKKFGGRLLRSRNGSTDWEYTNWDEFLNGGMVWALESGSILIADRIDNSGLYRSTLYRSTDNGDSVEPVLSYGGNGFSSDKAWLRHWSVYQAPHGTILVAEYGHSLLHSGRRIFRSADDGQTFTKVWDSLEEGEMYLHHHDLCYHTGLSRWIVAAGDGTPYRRLLANDNDGHSGFWYNLTAPHRTYLQPTGLLDYGHPTRLLYGADSRGHVGWVDVSDANAGRFGNLITNWDPRAGHAHCFLLFEHSGVYYACNYASDLYNPNNAIISVSTDLKNWAVYHRFTNNEIGAVAFAGYGGGKLHLNVLDANAYESHFVISPAQVSTQKSVVLEPGTNNRFDDSNKSSLEENLNGWLIPSCAWVTREVTVYEKKHGDACLHLAGSVSVDCYGCVYSPTISIETGRTYQGRFWIKSSNGTNTHLGSKYQTISSVGNAVYAHVDDTWQEVILEPYAVGPNDGSILRLFMCLGQCDEEQDSEQIEVYIDCLQVEQVPTTNWQLGGTPRADTNLRSVETLPTEWTNVFTFYPGGRKEYYDKLASGRKLHIKSWSAGGMFAELYFDPNASDPNEDDKFVLHVSKDAASYSVRTETQHFQRLAQLKFAIVCYQDEDDGNKTKLKMHVANGQCVETPIFSTPESFDSFCLGTVTTRFGNKNGLGGFPGLLSHDDFVDEAIEDHDVKRLLDLAGTGLLVADLNGDLCVNFLDMSTLSSHWLDSNCVFPELCEETDLDWSGEVDHTDLSIFAESWLVSVGDAS